ncbi:hypothetical protein SCHPADRAFT_941104 [Schizopora paradoxa]|uniref:Yeast cell wall synthesis Kre9/Knh1-like N-terminal domain-containing protein n=1 Tax=Schizopora paradoxa TaxID=27342 RepID=A0A0H2RM07_9AGAM|nr:hypothetical protein SCHPADRAFT_941104 [Schizopora paradoxa]
MRLTLRNVVSVLAMITFSVPSFGIEITQPSGIVPWLQNEPNLIAWTFVNGDPSNFSVIINNQNMSVLNGNLVIVAIVKTSDREFNVSNVTLPESPGYRLTFADPLNSNEIFAQSAAFSILPP